MVRLLQYNPEYSEMVKDKIKPKEEVEAPRRKEVIEREELAKKLGISSDLIEKNIEDVEKLFRITQEKERHIVFDPSMLTEKANKKVEVAEEDLDRMSVYSNASIRRPGTLEPPAEDEDPLEKFMNTIEKVELLPVEKGPQKPAASVEQTAPTGEVAAFAPVITKEEIEQLLTARNTIPEEDSAREFDDKASEEQSDFEVPADFDQINFDPAAQKPTPPERQILEVDHVPVVIANSLDDRLLPEDDYNAQKEKLKAKKEIKTTGSAFSETWKKNIYFECPEITELSEQDVEALRVRLGNIKVRGLNPPRPIFSWFHCNLPQRLLTLLTERLNFGTPFPIQCQAIPAILSGRDVIGAAETGSGKTLAYVLPMINHILAQRRVETGEGPIAIILVPTRELALQVFSTVKLFSKAVGLRSATIYGGLGLSGQLKELKKGVEIAIATPGRLIDLLTSSGGNITSLNRVTFVVIDEADRMFDLGFEPQIGRILRGIPNHTRQILMFSATFPKNVEALVKSVLSSPLEIVVGQRGQIARNITHSIEFLEEGAKILRLLEALGQYLDTGSAIVFVDTQAQADQLYSQLLAYKHRPLLLHGGQDQSDREQTFEEFKSAPGKLLVATSLAARGLDCSHVMLVVNYYCPTHKEEYIHRIGRTGRAGKKGYALTFITSEEDKYAGDIIQALQISNATVDPKLNEMYKSFKQKVHRGEVKEFKNKNLGGRGFKFDPEETAQIKAIQKLLSKSFNFDPQNQEDEETEELIKKITQGKQAGKDPTKLVKDPRTLEEIKSRAIKATLDAINLGLPQEEVQMAAQNAIRDFLLQMNPGYGGKGRFIPKKANCEHDPLSDKFSAELEINNYPEETRRKVTSKDFLQQMGDLTGTQISVRGFLVKPGAKNTFGHKRLHLLVEAESKNLVMSTLQELERLCEENAIGAIKVDS